MINLPLNTIVIPVYNGGNLLKEAIQSALNQTYTNIEILVVDDGSNDEETREVIHEFQGSIRAIRKKNGGTGSALNLGFAEAKGEYIHWLSHDDIFLPGKVKADMMLFQKAKNPESSISLSGWHFIDLQRKILSTRDIVSEITPKLAINPYWLLLLSMANGCTICIPKAMYLSIGQFREDLRTTQDYDYWLRLFPNSEILISQEIHVANRIHAGQGSNTIYNHNEEADEIYLKIVKASLINEGELLELEVPNSLYRIIQHLAPSSYESSKHFVNQLFNRIISSSAEDEINEAERDALVEGIRSANSGVFK
jgi:glycosyltransferase involved in cell wall biosynthesis